MSKTSERTEKMINRSRNKADLDILFEPTAQIIEQ